MGYYTNVTGEILIEPPIPWGEIRDSEYLHGDDGWTVGDCSLALRIDEAEVETDEGTLVRREATAVEPVTDNSYRAGGDACEADLQCILNHHGEGRTFTGRLNGEGEDNGDMWRLYVRDGRAVLVRARIVWDDETT